MKIIINNIIGYGLIFLTFVCLSIQRNLLIIQDLDNATYNFLFFVPYLSLVLFTGYSIIKLYKLDSGDINFRVKTSIIIVLLTLNFLLSNHLLFFSSSFSSWVYYFFMLMISVVIILPFKSYLPKKLQYALDFSLGAFLLVTIYFTLYLLPTYPLLFSTSIFFGFSLLGFVPLILSVYFIKKIQQNILQPHRLFALAGLISGLLFSATYISILNKNDNKIASVTKDELAAAIPINGFTEKLIMGSYVYDSFQNYWVGDRRGKKHKRHDPLVSVALLFSNQDKLNKSERVALLTNQFSKLNNAHSSVWKNTLFKAEESINSNHQNLGQWYLVVFVFPTLLLLSFNKISKTDF